jgi:hypothetical protein
LEILERDKFSCSNCGDTESTLHVHHRRYVKGRKAWEYTDAELETLCEPCHADEHRAAEMMQALNAEPEFHVKAAYAFLVGYMAGGCSIGIKESDQAIEIDGFNYDLGVLASIACGVDWPLMAKAARALAPDGRFSPAQENALARWEGSEDA